MVPITPLRKRSTTRGGVDFLDFVAHQEARHVEVVYGHVEEDAAGDFRVAARRRRSSAHTAESASVAAAAGISAANGYPVALTSRPAVHGSVAPPQLAIRNTIETLRPPEPV
jgi:hypothetical protein